MQRLILGALLILISYKPVSAVSTTIINSPTSVGDEVFVLTVSVSGATAGTNYLRADLYLPESKNYFGETDNTQAWYGGSDGKQYYPVTILSGESTIATISARLGEPSLTDYPGPGLYKLRIRRYTGSGNQGSEDPQPVDITLTKTYPSPSPTPTPSPTAQSSPSPTPTPSPSPSVPSPVPSAIPSPKPSVFSSPGLASPESGTVSGATDIDLSAYGLSSPSPFKEEEQSTPSPSLILNRGRARLMIMVGSGLILLATSIYLWYRKRIKGIIT
ncbi:MAG: hypothetical protein E6Q53_01865 [Candidatus Moraniibacteriota bacterium]|nr:MAG: hypothetical protein E6Q53_01865 [Candidatus Moranbacteria bacterium]